MKSSHKMFIATSAVCVLPLIMSAIVYKDLPEYVVSHWNFAGEPNGYSPKFLAAYGLPLMFLLVNAITFVQIYNDPKRANLPKPLIMFGLWTVPVLSATIVPITLLIALGVDIKISVIVPVLVGTVLILIGNYLPKSRQNYTVGIKLPWTLHDEENWNKTHRIAGYLWVIGGAVLIVYSLIPGARNSANSTTIVISIVFFITLLPTLYSFMLYRKSLKN